MSVAKPTNPGASVRQKLLNLSRERREEFQFVLTQYALERFLFRLGQSPHSEKFVLKGAMLFMLWMGRLHRVTQDMDLLAFGDSSIANLEDIFREICQIKIEEDGLQFLPNTVRGKEIREGQMYGGIRMQFIATGLLGARIPLQIDIGVGDAITPSPKEATYPTLLTQPPPRIRVYSRETVVAEKFEAMVKLEMTNSRMKDFFDLSILADQFSFEGELLCRAIKATFERRKTEFPNSTPLALTQEFAAEKQKLWGGFLKRSKINKAEMDFKVVVKNVRAFLEEPIDAIAKDQSFKKTWKAGGAWK